MWSKWRALWQLEDRALLCNVVHAAEARHLFFRGDAPHKASTAFKSNIYFLSVLPSIPLSLKVPKEGTPIFVGRKGGSILPGPGYFLQLKSLSGNTYTKNCQHHKFYFDVLIEIKCSINSILILLQMCFCPRQSLQCLSGLCRDRTFVELQKSEYPWPSKDCIVKARVRWMSRGGLKRTDPSKPRLRKWIPSSCIQPSISEWCWTEFAQPLLHHPLHESPWKHDTKRFFG